MEIEKGVPKSRGGKWVNILRQMKVGDSFFVKSNPKEKKNKQLTLTNSSYICGIRITTRSVAGGFRVWRMKDRTNPKVVENENMDGIKIEKNIPISSIQKSGKWVKVLRKMDVGDSFLVQCKSNNDKKIMRSRIYYTAKHRTRIKIKTHSTKHNLSIRVWRVS